MEISSFDIPNVCPNTVRNPTISTSVSPAGSAFKSTFVRKWPFNHLLVRFHCQQECRNTNGKHGHHGNLRWFQRIGDHKRHRKQRQQKAENIFYQKQACRSFDIINDPTSFQYNRRHTRKIRFQQYQLRSLCCCVTSRRPSQYCSQRLSVQVHR